MTKLLILASSRSAVVVGDQKLQRSCRKLAAGARKPSDLEACRWMPSSHP